MEAPGKLPSGIKEQNRARSSLGFFSLRVQELSISTCKK